MVSVGCEFHVREIYTRKRKKNWVCKKNEWRY